MQLAWHWQESDRILNTLPLHHVHGVVNVVNTALASGATIDMMEKFDAKKVPQIVAIFRITFVN